MENKEWKPQDFSKEKTAVALSYDPNDIAPKIVATGKGHVAEKIITSAKENDVPFYQENWQIPYPNLTLEKPFHRNYMRSLRRYWSLWTAWKR